MVARKPGRFLAPVALIAVAVAVGVIVNAHGGSHPAAASSTATHQTLPTTHHHQITHKPRFYVIKAGDSLSTISVKTGVPIATLTALNPGLNPAALQTGQRIKLRR